MKLDAFHGELPINAFRPRCGRFGMTLEGGGNPISSVTDAIGNIGQGAIDTVGDLGAGLDRTVRDVVPGGWTGAALIAAGAYYAPEIGAWLDSSGAVVPGSAGVAPEAGAIASPVTQGAVTGTELGTLANPTAVGAGTAANLGTATGADLSAAYDMGAVGSAGAGGATSLGAVGAGAAAAGAGAGAAGGSALSGMLPYMAAGQVATGLIGANAAKDAANQQTAAANAAIAQQQKNFDTINAQQAPYRAAGYGSLNQLANLGSGQTQQYDANGNVIGNTTGASDYLTHQFNAKDLAAGLAPNYDFMLQQGQMANQRAANVGGGALSGNTLQGLNKYTQDYAGNAYQNAFTNYQNQRSNIYNTLAGIAGIGQTGQNATNAAATNATNAATQLGVGSAAAQAAGTTGTANAYGNALNNVTNSYTLASLLNQGGQVPR